MRQHMPGTTTDPEAARRYADGEGSIFDIAEDLGPREATTLDLLFDSKGFAGRVRGMREIPVGLMADLDALVYGEDNRA